MYTCNRKSISLFSGQTKLIHAAAVTQHTWEHTSNCTLAVPEEKKYAVKSACSSVEVNSHKKNSVTIYLFATNIVIYRE